MEKFNKSYIEIFNKQPVLKSRISTGTNNATVSFLKTNNYIKNVESIENVPNLYRFELANSNKIIFAFIFDIVPACTSDLEDKRVQIKPETLEFKQYLKYYIPRINVICGYCEFGNEIFCYNDQASFVSNNSNTTTSVHIKLHWLFKSLKENQDWILLDEYRTEKFSRLLVTNNINSILESLNGEFDLSKNNKNIKTYFRSSPEILKYKEMVLSVSNYKSDISSEKNQQSEKNEKIIDENDSDFLLDNIKPFSSFLKSNINSNENNKEKVGEELNDIDKMIFSIDKTSLSFKTIKEKIYSRTIIDPLKVEMLFNDILISDFDTRNKILLKMNENYISHVWKNENQESYLQYDFLINDNVYVDIKSTWKNDNLSFHISESEQEFRNSIGIFDNCKYFIVLFYDIQMQELEEKITYKMKILSNEEIDNLESKKNFQYFLGVDGEQN